MSTHLLLHTLSRMTFLVDRDAGQWMTYEASPELIPLPLVTMVDRPYGRLFLVFKDAEAIAGFLADPDPRIELIQKYVRMARQYQSVVVMTAGELLDFARTGGSISERGQGPWMTSLAKITIDYSYAWYSVKLIQMCVPGGWWFWYEIVLDDVVAYQFRKALEYGDAVIAAVRRGRPPGALQSESRMFSLRGFVWPESFGEATEGGVLVVPDDPQRPLLHLGTSRIPRQDRSFTDSVYPATVYELTRPTVFESTKGSKTLAVRTLPVDVMTAA